MGVIVIAPNEKRFKGHIKRSLYAHHRHVYGILVAILYKNNGRHHLPHIHVRYSDMKASISIEGGRVLAGEIQAKQKIEAPLLESAA